MMYRSGSHPSRHTIVSAFLSLTALIFGTAGLNPTVVSAAPTLTSSGAQTTTVNAVPRITAPSRPHARAHVNINQKVLTVTQTTDATSCAAGGPSLACAITQANADCANATAACDVIQFAIPTSGTGSDVNCGGIPAVCVITPGSALPALTSPYIKLDGYSQPGALANTHTDPRAGGDNAKIAIQLKKNCLVLNGSHQTVQGLSLTDCDSEIYLSHADHATILGNFVGIYPDGRTSAGGRYGVLLTDGSSNNVVGGTLTGGPTADSLGIGSVNLISAGTSIAVWDNSAVDFTTYVSTGNVIKGNIVGMQADAVTRAGSVQTGIQIEDYARGTVGVTIGGAIPPGGTNGDGNLVGYAGSAISVVQTAGTTSASIFANYLGVTSNGNPIPNNTGVRVVGATAVLGAPNDNYGLSLNTIADNAVQAVFGGAPNPHMTRVAIYRNIMYGNGAAYSIPEINLTASGPGPLACTADLPPRANDGILCPVITSVSSSQIAGTSCAGCVIDVYVATNGIGDLGHGGGRRWLGEIPADGNGNWSMSSFLTPFDPGHQAVTATATRLDASGVPETSEFAANVSAPDHAFVVTQTGDSNADTPCEDTAMNYVPTLRCAISNINVSTATSSTPGNSVTFAIPGATDPTVNDPNCAPQTIGGAAHRVCKIVLTSMLPTVSGSNVTIDGYSQSGASANSNPHPLAQGDNAVISLEVDSGRSVGYLFSLSGSHQTIQGLSLFQSGGGSGSIRLGSTSSFDAIQGNIVGLAADGSVPNATTTVGVEIDQGSHDNTVGGTLNPGSGAGFAAVNVLTHCFYGVYFYPQTTRTGANNVVKGNIIGAKVGADAVSTPGEQHYGIYVNSYTGATIGGTTMTTDGVNADANLIGGWAYGGVYVTLSPDTTIQGNFIGVGPTGTTLPNHYSGIAMTRGSTGTIGGSSAAAANTIANNNIYSGTTPDSPNSAGISIGDGTAYADHVAVQQNSMFNNLGNDGIALYGQQPNTCTQGPTAGINQPNDYTPCPTFTITTTSKVSGLACSGCTVDVYLAPSGTDIEGKTWLGSVVAATCNTAGCTMPWTLTKSTFVTPVNTGDFITATSSTPATPGPVETSEFVQPVAATQAPPATLIVNTTSDAVAPCSTNAYSLRCAIIDANSDGTGDTIKFHIDGCTGNGGQCPLTLGNKLPALTASNTTIDGYSQPGASANTHPLLGASGTGDNAVILIKLDGTGRGNETTGLEITGNNNTVRGLSIINFSPTNSLQPAIHLNGSTGNVIAGNFIGVPPSGTVARPNSIGILADNGAFANTFGGTQPADENVISGNTYSGIAANALCYRSCSTPGNDVVEGNAVGTDKSGTHAIPNGTDDNVHAPGIDLSGASDTVHNNLVSGNAYIGIRARGDNNTIQGNYVGTDPSGTAGVGNGVTGTNHNAGVWRSGLLADGTSSLIGGPNAGDGNLVSGNGDGTSLSTGMDPWGYQETVQGNTVGTDITGTVALPNRGYAGMEASGSEAIVGGTTPGARNLVSGNTGYGIAEDGGASTILGNYVGTNRAGTAAIPNSSAGIYADAYSDVIGGTAAGAGNLVSGNAGPGIFVDTTDNIVQGNYVGTDAAGTSAIPNSGAGIDTTGDNTLIGGTVAGASNLVSGNSGDGIDVHPPSLVLHNAIQSKPTTVQRNKIGVDAAGTGSLGNAGNGIAVYPSQNNNPPVVHVIAGNTIGHNGKSGVLVGSSTTDTITHASITGNSMFGDGGLGIDLWPQGTVNCANSAPGPNDYIQCPVIGSATDTAITGTACANCTVEVFISDTNSSGYGEGRTSLGTVTADNAGNWTMNAPYSPTLSLGQMVTASATSPASPGPVQTSEFAANVTVVSNKPFTGLVVTTTSDLSSPCTVDANSLRCAIDQANKDGSGKTITFHIDGCTGTNGICPLTLQSKLPSLTASNTTIDGYSQPGASPNTHPLLGPSGTGDNAVILIKLDGTGRGNETTGLDITGNSNVVRGLSIVNFSPTNSLQPAIRLDGGTGNVIAGNFIGVPPNGVVARPNSVGIRADNGASGNTIGGLQPADENVISGNTHSAIVSGPACGSICTSPGNDVVDGNAIGTDASGTRALPNGTDPNLRPPAVLLTWGSTKVIGNVVSGNGFTGILSRGDNSKIRANYVGTDASGTAAIPNGDAGIDTTGDGTVIGGATARASNVVSGNRGDGIDVHPTSSALGTTIQTNNVGVDAPGTGSLGNGGNGIHVYPSENSSAGPVHVVTGNTIGHNGKSGVLVGSSPTDTKTHVSITGNSMSGDTGLGIDLWPQGTVNCSNSAPGPNDYIQCPVISSATDAAITGTACAGCNVEIFISDSNASGYGEGRTSLGTVTADNSGIWTMNAPYTPSLNVGQVVTATATRPAARGPAETSEFAANVTVTKMKPFTGLVVTTTGDPTPPCRPDANSLRCAMDKANKDGNGDTISFDIPTTDKGCSNGVCTMTPGSALPPLTAGNTTIDGYTQPGAQPNTQTLTDDATIAIRLDGVRLRGLDGIYIIGTNDTVQGLSITNFALPTTISGTAIRFFGQGASGGNVLGCFLGLTPDGSTPGGNNIGVAADRGVTGLHIGSSAPRDRNLIAGSFYGVYLSRSGGNFIQGNFFGPDRNGNVAAGRGNSRAIALVGEGLTSDPTSGDLIGGPSPGQGNVISGNTAYALTAANRADDNVGATNAYNTIQSNIVGANPAGTGESRNVAGGMQLFSAHSFLVADNIISGNGGDALLLSGGGNNRVTRNSIGIGSDGSSLPNGGGGIVLARSERGDSVTNNTIASNKGIGVQAGINSTDPVHDLISRNSFFNNGGGGIKLIGQAVDSCFYSFTPGTPNDLTPCPLIKSATTDAVTGEACAGCTLEVFIAASPTDNEGKTYLGSVTAPTCAAPCSGITAWTLPSSSYVTPLSQGQYVTVTATAPASANTPAETSGFSWEAPVGVPIVVNTASDLASPCAPTAMSLHCALDQANTDGAGDSIYFAIPSTDGRCKSSGVCTLSPTVPLPVITAPWTAVFGYTQTASRPNTRLPASAPGGDDAFPALEIGPQNLPTASNGITVQAPHVDIEGFSIRAYSAGRGSSGIHLSRSSAQWDVVSGNFIGVASDGTTAAPNSIGVLVDGGAAHELIGLLLPADSNVISGNGNYGLQLSGAGKNVVMGNLIGTAASGETSAKNGFAGAFLFATDGNTIGGPTVGAGNVISGNASEGIAGTGATNTTISANRIGVDGAGTKAVPNTLSGIYLYAGANNTIGGGTDALANIVGGNGGNAIDLLGEATDSVSHNIIGSGPVGVPNGGAGVLVGSTNEIQTAARRGYLPVTAATGGHRYVSATISTNRIVGNGTYGVQIGRSKTEKDVHVLVTQNSMSGNKVQGIRLAASSLNCASGAAVGPNDNLTCPSIISASPTRLESISPYCLKCTVEYFKASPIASDNNHGQGSVYLGTGSPVLGAAGHYVLNLPPGVLTRGDTVTCVNTYLRSTTVPPETSQFSANILLLSGK